MIRFKILFLYLNAYYTEFLGLAEISEVDYQKWSCLISLVTSGRETSLRCRIYCLSESNLKDHLRPLLLPEHNLPHLSPVTRTGEKISLDFPICSFLFELQKRFTAMLSQSFIAPCLSLNFLISHWIINFPGTETLKRWYWLIVKVR